MLEIRYIRFCYIKQKEVLMTSGYKALIVDIEQASQILDEQYGIQGILQAQNGEFDFNFKVESHQGNYLLKISRPDCEADFVAFQTRLDKQLQTAGLDFCPQLIENKSGEAYGVWDLDGSPRMVRLYKWIEGKLWSSVVDPMGKALHSLAQCSSALSSALLGFEDDYADRHFKWDIAQGLWVEEHLSLFSEEKCQLIQPFLKAFKDSYESYSGLRKAIIHNDINDNNIIVRYEDFEAEVCGIIDFGDAIYSQQINEVAVMLAYACMNRPDPLNVAVEFLKTYHNGFALEERELEHLYNLVAMRLILSVTISSLNAIAEPENEYLLISQQDAWNLLEKWASVNGDFAHYSFRSACAYTAHPNIDSFMDFVKTKDVALSTLFPTVPSADGVFHVDMSLASSWLGPRYEFTDNDLMNYKLAKVQEAEGAVLIAGGYMEPRAYYSTKAYEREGNYGLEHRTVHLGLDVWLAEGSPLHSPFDGKVFSIYNNDNDKDYGPTLILEHKMAEGKVFYTLYGHLSRSTLDMWKKGDEVRQGEHIAYIGAEHENGIWNPHLHFQIMLDMLGNTHDFPGVAFPRELSVWSGLCPNPNLIFKESSLDLSASEEHKEEMLRYRNAHLGKGMSLSYKEPLQIVRGEGCYLYDIHGRRYMDTVNNVAHVGHEEESVVKAGQAQMGLLNTNTRYLNRHLLEAAKELLSIFPEQLSVVHFVNSGSEANELALRMAKTCTGRKDILALEVGYHGNTNATVDISSYKFDGKGGSGKPAHTHLVALPDTFRGQYRGGDAESSYLNDFRTYLDGMEEAPAAFIAESIVSCGGQIELPKEYLGRAYEMVREKEALCIADEVQVGLGRVGSKWWGFELYGVVPDIVTIGKPLGNGHPVAAVVCTEEVANGFANGMEYFNTFGGNPVSAVVAKAVIQRVKTAKLRENATELGGYWKERLEQLAEDFPIIADVRGQGLFLGFELCDDQRQPLPKETAFLSNKMKTYGILTSVDGPKYNVIKIKPPMCIDREAVDLFMKSLRLIMAQIKEGA